MALFTQERHVEALSDNLQVFIITSRLVSFRVPGDGGDPAVPIAELPHANVFVLKIADRDDPKDDTLARVARVSDLLVLPIGRDEGLVKSTGVGGLYLTPSCRLEYATLEEALAAQTAIKDRVNALINTWINFKDQFNAPDPAPAEYILPTPDQGQLCNLIAAYKSAKQERYTAQLNKDAAQAAKTAAENDLTYKQALLASAEATCALRARLATDCGTAGSVLAAAQTYLVLAENGLTECQTAEYNTWHAVRMLAPDFDRRSIAFVDDDELTDPVLPT